MAKAITAPPGVIFEKPSIGISSLIKDPKKLLTRASPFAIVTHYAKTAHSIKNPEQNAVFSQYIAESGGYIQADGIDSRLVPQMTEYIINNPSRYPQTQALLQRYVNNNNIGHFPWVQPFIDSGFVTTATTVPAPTIPADPPVATATAVPAPDTGVATPPIPESSGDRALTEKEKRLIAAGIGIGIGATTITDGTRIEEKPKKKMCKVGSYKDLKCAPKQAHHIVPDFTLRLGIRGSHDRIPGVPSFNEGMAICLSGNASTPGTEHNIAQQVDFAINELGKTSSVPGTINVEIVKNLSIASAIAAKKGKCAAEIIAAVNAQYAGVPSNKLLRSTRYNLPTPPVRAVLANQ